jgi:hypothetical protein
MDAKRFDAMTKDVAGRSRRRVLGGLLAGLAGGLGLLGVQPGAAQDYENRGQRCNGNESCNAPCRYCHLVTGRCIYACDNASEVCIASQSGCLDRNGNPMTKGCCVPA